MLDKQGIWRFVANYVTRYCYEGIITESQTLAHIRCRINAPVFKNKIFFGNYLFKNSETLKKVARKQFRLEQDVLIFQFVIIFIVPHIWNIPKNQFLWTP